MNTTRTIKPHGKRERGWRVIGISVCVTLACLAFLVGAFTLASTMQDTTAPLVSTVHCDTTSAISINNAYTATSIDPETCPITDPSYVKESVLK